MFKVVRMQGILIQTIDLNRRSIFRLPSTLSNSS